MKLIKKSRRKVENVIVSIIIVFDMKMYWSKIILEITHQQQKLNTYRIFLLWSLITKKNNKIIFILAFIIWYRLNDVNCGLELKKKDLSNQPKQINIKLWVWFFIWKITDW